MNLARKEKMMKWLFQTIANRDWDISVVTKVSKNYSTKIYNLIYKELQLEKY